MLTMSCEVQQPVRQTDEHSDAGSDTENTSHVADYRTDGNMSLPLVTPDRGIRRKFDERASDSDSCDGDAELSPMQLGKRFKPDSFDDEGKSKNMFGNGKSFCIFLYI